MLPSKLTQSKLTHFWAVVDRRPNLAAKIGLAHHHLNLPAGTLNAVPVPIHRIYNFPMSALPVIRVEEAIAEKLVRLRRIDLARDLHDLAWYAHRACNQLLVARGSGCGESGLPVGCPGMWNGVGFVPLPIVTGTCTFSSVTGGCNR
jgi:hypothetical protein